MTTDENKNGELNVKISKKLVSINQNMRDKMRNMKRESKYIFISRSLAEILYNIFYNIFTQIFFYFFKSIYLISFENNTYYTIKCKYCYFPTRTIKRKGNKQKPDKISHI